MRKLQKNTSIENDLNQAADDLQQMAGHLLDLSVQMIEGGNDPASQLMTQMIVSLQENESMLRRHADILKIGRLGRRSGD